MGTALFYRRKSSLLREYWKSIDNPPQYLWVPDDVKTLNTFGAAQGRADGGANIVVGGLANPIASTTIGRGLRFDSNFGLSSTRSFFCAMLVWVDNPASMQGMLAKFGTSGGAGVGVGNANADTAGSQLLLLKEGVSWTASGANAFVRGINLVCFFALNSGSLFSNAFPNSTGDTSATGGWNTAEQSFSINSSTGSRASNVKVLSFAHWLTDLPDGASGVSFRAKILNKFNHLYGRLEYLSLFAPTRGSALVAAWPDSAGTAYTLSCATTAFTVGYNSASLTKSLNLKGSATAYTVGYNSAGITKSLNLKASATAYTVGYNSAALTKAWALACAATSYTVGYNNAALTKGWALQATTTAYQVVGNAANITTTAHSAYTLACETTAYVVNGNLAELTFKKPDAGGAGKGKKNKKRRRIVLNDKVYDVLERDIPALLEAELVGRKPPKTAEVVAEVEDSEDDENGSVEAESVGMIQWSIPSVDEAVTRYNALLDEIQGQAQADVAKLLAKVAERVIADLEDEEEAVSLLLMH